MQRELYSICQKEMNNEGVQAEVCIHADHPILAGHFPGQPIFPGVCMLDMVISIWNLHFSKEYKIKRIFRMKFIQAITAQYFDNISLSIHPINGLQSHLKAEIKKESIIFFTMEAELIEDLS